MTQTLRRQFLWGLLILALVSAPAAGFAQGIFKCTAEDGQVRFSDKPAPNGNCETVEVAPEPDDSRVDEASEIEQGIKKSGEMLAEDRRKREAEREKLAEERRKREEEEAEKARQREAEIQQYNNWRYRDSWPLYPPRPVPPIHRPHPPDPEHPIEQPQRPSQLNPPLRSSGTHR